MSLVGSHGSLSIASTAEISSGSGGNLVVMWSISWMMSTILNFVSESDHS
jgi:hypothetical protein